MIFERFIRHLPDCGGADLEEFTGRLGDALVRCRGCGRMGLAGLPAAKVPPLSPRRVVTGWVCGEHLDRPVTWRGTGCPECAADRDARARLVELERARRRAEREAQAGQ